MIDKFRRWGSGCKCHEAELGKGKRVVCSRKGRRLPEAKKQLDILIEDCEKWLATATVELCSGIESVLESVCFIVRRFMAEIRDKFRFLTELPYILASITEPETAAEAIRQWRTYPSHHRRTISFMSQHEDAVAKIASGDVSNIPEAVHNIARRMQNIPLTSQLAEGYHRGARLTRMRGARSRMPYVFSMQRHNQVLDHIKRWLFLPGGRQAFVYEYRNFQRILQTTKKLFLKKKKMKRRALYSKIYRLGHHAMVDFEAMEVEPHDAGDKGGNDDDAGGNDDARDDAGHNPGDTGYFEGGLGGAPAETSIVPAVAMAPPPVHLSPKVPLQQQYLLSALKAGRFYTVPIQNPLGPDRITYAFQVLHVSTRVWVALHSITKKRNIGFNLWVQPFHVIEEVEGIKRIAADGDAEEIDLTALASWGDIWDRMFVWSSSAGPVAGIVSLADPQTSRPQLALDSPKVPCLMLMRELQSRNMRHTYIRESKHRPGEEEKYSCIKAHLRREYYQCLLNLQRLFDNGLEELISNGLKPWYKLLLRGIVVQHGKKAKEYRFMLANNSTEPMPIAPLPLPPSDAPLPLPDDDSDEILQPLDDVAAAATPVAPAAEETSSATESSAGSILEPAVSTVKPLGAPEDIGGMPLCYEDRSSTHGYIRYILGCPYHWKCTARRSVSARMCKNLGQWEPVAFLACWQAKGAWVDAATHKDRPCKNSVTVNEMRDWLQAHGFPHS